jgi:hypothetical protein
MPGFRFRLLDEDGTDLGPFVATVPRWQPGQVIHYGPSVVLKVVRVVDVEGAYGPDNLRGYLVLQEVGDAVV